MHPVHKTAESTALGHGFCFTVRNGSAEKGMGTFVRAVGSDGVTGETVTVADKKVP